MSTNLVLVVIYIISYLNDARITLDLTPHDLDAPIQYKIQNTFTLAKTGESQSIDLTNSLDRIYTGQISIGTPSTQTFNVVFDTGSADLWIFSSYHTCFTANSCSNDWNEYQCGSNKDDICCFFNDIMNDYDNQLSSTYQPFNPQQDWSITYGKGSASGYLSRDNVNIGGLIAENQVFAEATSWSDLLISCSEPMSGILGFAMRAASEDGSDTVIETLHKQNKISNKLFSVSLKGDDGNSKLIIGEPDTAYYKSDIVWGDVIQPTSTGMWFTQLTGIVLTETNELGTDVEYQWVDTCVDTAPCLALIDTGTSYITMPSGAYYSLIDSLLEHTSQIGNRANCIKYNTEFMCSTRSYTPDEDLPYLWFQVGGYGFKLAPSQYMLTGSDSCAVGYDCLGISFLDSMGEHTYIMGDTFLREYYLVFDESNYRIGFAAMEPTIPAAIPRPPVTDFWSYIEVGSYIIGAIGVIVCICASLWKLRQPSNYGFWKRQQVAHDQYDVMDNDYGNVYGDDGNNIGINDNDNNQTYQNDVNIADEVNVDDDEEDVCDNDTTVIYKDYRTKIREHREAFLNSNIISAMSGTSPQNNIDDGVDSDIITTNTEYNFSDDNDGYQVL